MTALEDLIGPGVPPAEDTVGWWRMVPEFSLGGNDRYGNCAFVALANFLDLVAAVNGKPFVIGEAECENFYRVEAGFNSQDPSTDKGAVLRNVIAYWQANGWPGDPTLVPVGWCEIGHERIYEAINGLGAVVAWCMLPRDTIDPDEWDFTDDAVDTAAEGIAAHAVLIVGSGPDSLYLVSWARVEKVSYAWWAEYGRECFAIRHPEWKRPATPVVGV